MFTRKRIFFQDKRLKTGHMVTLHKKNVGHNKIYAKDMCTYMCVCVYIYSIYYIHNILKHMFCLFITLK